LTMLSCTTAQRKSGASITRWSCDAPMCC
jgi:hypothetical protein